MSVREITRKRTTMHDRYPFNLDIVRKFDGFEFSSPVTIIVGDNGCGKTTLLEGIAAAAGSILISGEHMEKDHSLSPAFELAEDLKIIWSIKSNNGFFFRAADFITYTRSVATMREDARAKIEEIKQRNPYSLEVLPYAKTYHELCNLYGEGLEKRSHGESFFDLFQARFRPGGFYILDEPEAPLSPQNQLTLLAMIHEMTKEGAQFLISTHSPIMMAYPYADLYEVQNGVLEPAIFDELSHVQITRDFLHTPKRFLRHLFN